MEKRPDGRTATPQTLRLRTATRTLRLHLDELPIDYDLAVPGDRFLAGMAFMFARQRYACAESMIGSGFGGTVIGSMARGLFVDGLRWLWIANHPDRRRCLLGELRDERNRLCILLEETDASIGNKPRWLMPLPDIADLTGQSLSWLDAPPMPDDAELLDHFLARRVDPQPSSGSGEHAELLRRTHTLLDMSGLRGAVMVLAHAGHGNHLGLLSSLTEDGAAACDLRADHEALFMQVAAVGVAATLLGVAETVPETWPADVSRRPFLERAVELAADVAAAAVPIHKLDTARRPTPQARKKSTKAPPVVLMRPGIVLDAEELLPDVNSVDAVIAAAQEYDRLTRSGWSTRPQTFDQPTLHAKLAYNGGHSNLQAVMATYDKPGSAVIAPYAARMLLEEAARMRWRYSAGDPEAFKVRAKQYFDEFRARRRKTIETLAGSGVPRAEAHRIFALPGNIQVITPEDEIAPNRQALPKIDTMLREMGAPYPEPGWLEVAYSLLSQITHSTALGHLHAIRFRHDTLVNELSPEMLGLTLDVACLGSAHLIGMGARLLTGDGQDAVRYHQDLVRQAAMVHSAAQWVHGLD
ncbi:hypothetical protein FHX81_7968 [Saccharothrix saharensis]|uniref:Uncharacterized protein n=1 Tax=Saccharothrix saharensis TaxID=571190 RepID=A0A543JRW3_9PSEU|nr:hypothetical protein [Saccharothrix saharensis]TQM85484.1 hypothetical protein FHX81_7968 [Saccharothrix saharensis]